MFGGIIAKILGVVALLAVGAAVFLWFNSATLRAERDRETAMKAQAIAANESLEAALIAQQHDAALRAAAQVKRAEEAEARAAALSKVRQKVIYVGTKDAAGPGVSAAVDGLRELAGSRDPGPDGRAPTGPLQLVVPVAPANP